MAWLPNGHLSIVTLSENGGKAVASDATVRWKVKTVDGNGDPISDANLNVGQVYSRFLRREEPLWSPIPVRSIHFDPPRTRVA